MTTARKIRPHKGGRIKNRLVQMTPETSKRMSEIIKILTRRRGKRVSFSDVIEISSKRLEAYLQNHPESTLDSSGEENGIR